MTKPLVSLDDIHAADARIRAHVRRTPVIDAAPLKQAASGARLTLKLECAQVTGSFKPRGAVSRLTLMDEKERRRGLVTASGGNHGLAVAYAGWVEGVSATVYLPRGAPAAKIAKIEAWNARAIVEGETWDEANAAATKRAAREGLAYIHPFADPAVIAGQGTVGLEVLDQAPSIDTLIVAIGGGGLIAGVATAVKALRPDIRVIGVEPTGAPTHYESRRAGELVTLEKITTEAGILAPRRSERINLDIIAGTVDDIVLVDDAEMLDAARWLWFELGVAAELGGAAALAALRAGRVDGGHVCVLICGAGNDGVNG
jgi:threonine dehydratase